MTATIHHGDCLEVLRGMPDNSVDSICCDPPYGLSNTSPDKVTETIVRWAQGDREYVPQGKGFMGASWDAFVPPVAVWDECLRVLKPGGHLVAFAGSRTQDLMGLAIRLAGFDIRENIAWLYGSGFPKSLDVSKAIDKAAGATREVVGRRTPQGGSDSTVTATHAPGGKFRWGDEHYNWDDLPENAREYFSGATARKLDITAPATPEAERWQGWGTALKPAHEPIILARKPIQGTVAANTLTWGTGGLNIDATRIAGEANRPMPRAASNWLLHGCRSIEELRDLAERGESTPDGRDARATLARAEADQGRYRQSTERATDQGRWPTNVVLDPDTAPALDEQSDGASRFFKVVEPDPPFMYAAKAPKKERPTYTTEDGQTVQHATVKPLSIMQWLVKLVTPEGGTVLDPFAGSGTTVEAAILEGFNVIGIEREAAYLPLIQQRIDRANDALPMAS